MFCSIPSCWLCMVTWLTSIKLDEVGYGPVLLRTMDVAIVLKEGQRCMVCTTIDEIASTFSLSKYQLLCRSSTYAVCGSISVFDFRLLVFGFAGGIWFELTDICCNSPHLNYCWSRYCQVVDVRHPMRTVETTNDTEIKHNVIEVTEQMWLVTLFLFNTLSTWKAMSF